MPCRGRRCQVCAVVEANEALADELAHESVWEDGEADDD
jgi:hypothetical protein